jgi:hypothetical protein
MTFISRSKNDYYNLNQSPVPLEENLFHSLPRDDLFSKSMHDRYRLEIKIETENHGSLPQHKILNTFPVFCHLNFLKCSSLKACMIDIDWK